MMFYYMYIYTMYIKNIKSLIFAQLILFNVEQILYILLYIYLCGYIYIQSVIHYFNPFAFPFYFRPTFLPIYNIFMYIVFHKMISNRKI